MRLNCFAISIVVLVSLTIGMGSLTMIMVSLVWILGSLLKVCRTLMVRRDIRPIVISLFLLTVMAFPDLLGGFEALNLVKITPLKSNEDQLPGFGILLKLLVVICIHQLAIGDHRDNLITKRDDVPALVVHLLNPCGVHV